ncbi:TPA: NadS family protein [Klebsiella pneumoniae]|nr:helix-turn-helix domain-containing protein [Klebsiella pneumoniae]HDY4998462.1 helix-turn-helix domain-containing protein [Klebsiella pneumoniae]
MEKELFDQLVESMEQMVAIEKGHMAPAAVHRHHLPDVKTLRAASELTQGEFADAVGVSPSLVQSWEQNRRVPSGSSLKLLLMIERNPALLNELRTI